jgi:uncharacterized protein YuzE
MLSVIDFDRENDVAYISLRPELRERRNLASKSVRVGDVVLDLGTDGQLVGIELLEASKYLGADVSTGLGDQIVGVKEAADLVGVEKSNFVRDYASRPGFPRPIAELASGRFWLRVSIERFLGDKAQRRRRRTAKQPATPSVPEALPPPTARGQIPEFFQLGAVLFQQLCAELHQLEPGLATAHVYGTNGQAQKGVDVVAYRSDHGIEAGQCKAVSQCSTALIRQSSTEFLSHLDYWRDQDVQKFILFVGTTVQRTELRDEIARQKQQFKTFGLHYELWSGFDIAAKLRSRPEVVRSYLPSYWMTELCGEATSGYPQNHNDIGRIAVERLADNLASHVSGDADRELDNLRQRWREGRLSEVHAGLERLRDGARWDVLAKPVQAKLIRFEGQLALESGDLKKAESLAQESRSLDPSANNRFEALLLRAQSRLDDALTAASTADDDDSRTLRAALLLEQGRLDEALDILGHFSNNAEAHRLKALGLLLKADLTGARLEIEKAWSLEPDWRAVIYVRSVIYYLSALSPAVVPSKLPQWPEPIDWSFVKTDDTSREFLRLAAEGFEVLGGRQSDGFEDRSIYDTWRLASLANDAERRSEAEDFARSVLERDVSNYRVLAWVLARRIDVDVSSAVSAIQDRLAKGAASPPELVALCIWHTQNGSVSAARRILDENRDLFERSEAIGLWELWEVQLAAAEGDVDGEQKADGPNGIEARIILLRAKAKKTGDPTALIQELRTQSEHDGEALVELSKVYGELGRWTEGAELVPALVDRVATADALKFACLFLFNTRRFEELLQLQDQHQSRYPRSELPTEMQRLRVAAQKELGILHDATAGAEALFRAEPSVAHFTFLCDLYFRKGDQKSLSVLARKHEHFAELKVSSLLRLAFQVIDEDLRLAAELWRRAASVGFDDDQVPAALDVGYKLGLDSEVRPLIERLTSLASKPDSPVRTFTVAQAIEQMKSHRDHSERVYAMYREGSITVHLVSSSQRWSLVQPYHRHLSTNQDKGIGSAPPTFVRHGWRVEPRLKSERAQPLRLHADITALLTAQHFGLLPEFERVFRPIALPNRTILALTEMREMTKPVQPSRVKARNMVLDAIDQQRIKAVHTSAIDIGNLVPDAPVDSHTNRLLRLAAEKGWLLADSLPLFNRDGKTLSDSLPAPFLELLRDRHSIIISLHKLGIISDERFQELFKAQGLREVPPQFEAIEANSTVLCRGHVLELLASGGALDLAAANFNLLLDGDEHALLLSERRAAHAGQEDADWLSELIDRLSRGLESGVYYCLRDTEEEAEATAFSSHLLHQCLADLLRISPDPGDVIWSDDRCLNGYVQSNGAPIVDTLDLVHQLRERGVFSQAAFLSLHARMRESNCRFIPLAAAELSAALEKATIDHNKLVESKTLGTIRRYYAHCLLDGQLLNLVETPKPVGSGVSEWPFLIQSGRAVTDALVEVWRAHGSEPKKARLLADWLLSSLYLPDRGRSSTKIQASADNDLHMEAVSIAGFFVQAIVFSPIDPNERRARRDYFDWLWYRLVQRRFWADPILAAATIDNMKRLLSSTLESANTATTRERKAAAEVAKALVADLPEKLARSFLGDGTFLETLGARRRPVLPLGNHHVDAEATWRTFETMFETGRASTLVKADDEVELELRIDEDKAIANDHAEKRCYILLPEAVGLLASSPSEREKALWRIAPSFDKPQSQLNETVASIAATTDVAQRMAAVQREQRTSAEFYYAHFATLLRQKQLLSQDDFLPPDVESLVRHLRFPTNRQVAFDESLSNAAEQLTHDVGLEAAIARLAGLPVPLPALLIEELSELLPDERRTTLGRLSRTLGGSPLGRAHLGRILTTFSSERVSYARLARRLIRRLLSDSDDTNAWLATIRRVAEDLAYTDSFRRMPSELRLTLIWTHGDRLFRVFTELGVPTSWISQNIEDDFDRLPSDVLFAETAQVRDVANPSRVRQALFSICAACYASGNSLEADVIQQIVDLIAADEQLKLSLSRDTSLAPDALGAILGSHYWLRLLPESLRGQLPPFSTQQMLDTALNRLESGSAELQDWLVVYAAWGDLLPPAEYRVRLSKAIAATDFVALCEANASHRTYPIMIASHQAAHLPPESLDNLRQQLIAVARFLSDRGFLLADGDSADIDALLSAAFQIACAFQGSDDELRQLVILLESLHEACPPIREKVRTVVSRFVDGLPVSSSRHFWRLQVRLRAA